MNTSKSLALLLIILMATSSIALLIAKPVSAQPVPKPSAPQFTTELIPSFLNTTKTDPYTGVNTTDTQNLSSIKLTITNQQYSYSNGSTFSIYYNVRVKGHFEPYSWSELYPTTQLLPASVNVTQLNPNNLQNYEVPYIWADGMVAADQWLPQSNSAYTSISLSADTFPSGGQVDIQVEAMLGVNSSFYRPSNQWAAGVGGSVYPAIAYVTSSGWGNTETINLTDGSVTNSTAAPTVTSTPTPTFTSTPNNSAVTGNSADSITLPLSAFGIVTAVGVVLAVIAVLLLLRKHPEPEPPKV